MGNIKSGSYLSYLQKKESKTLFSLRNKPFLHGQFSSLIRILKGLILGFGLGNLIIQVKDNSLKYSLIILLVSFCLSVLLIHYERRTYKRKTFGESVKRALFIFSICLLSSLLTLFYTNYLGFLVVLASTLFFSSLSYSME